MKLSPLAITVFDLSEKKLVYVNETAKQMLQVNETATVNEFLEQVVFLKMNGEKMPSKSNPLTKSIEDSSKHIVNEIIIEIGMKERLRVTNCIYSIKTDNGVLIIAVWSDMTTDIEMKYNLLWEKNRVMQDFSFFTVCLSCDRIKDEKGCWFSFPDFISDKTSINFSHGYCPDCFNDCKHL